MSHTAEAIFDSLFVCPATLHNISSYGKRCHVAVIHRKSGFYLYKHTVREFDHYDGARNTSKTTKTCEQSSFRAN